MGQLLRTLALFTAFGAYGAYIILFQTGPEMRSGIGRALTFVLLTWLVDRFLLILFTLFAFIGDSPPLWVWSLPDYLVAIAAVWLLVQAMGVGQLLSERFRSKVKDEQSTE